MAKPMCEEIEDENGLLIIDDALQAKPYMDCNDMISWCVDHTENQLVKGVNFISAIYNNWKMSPPTGVCFVNKDISYIDKQDKTKTKSSISKQEYFRTLVKHVNQIRRFRYVLSDSWFACSEKMKFVVEDYGRNFMMGMKENRKVALSKNYKANGK
jgi:hypothetical protein